MSSSSRDKEAAAKALLEFMQNGRLKSAAEVTGLMPKVSPEVQRSIEETDYSTEEFAKLIMEGQDRKRVRPPGKMKAKQKAAFDEALANFPDRMREAGRPVEELMQQKDKLTPAEAYALGIHAQDKILTPKTTDRYLSNILFVGDLWLLTKHLSTKVAEAADSLVDKYGHIEFDSTVPYPEPKAEAVRIVAEGYGKYRDGDLEETFFEMLWKGILMKTGSRDLDDREKIKEALAVTELLVQHGVPVDETNIMGYTALMQATGLMNVDMIGNLEFAEILFRAGADVNHRNRQGHTALGTAAMSSVTYGEDRKRSGPVKWLLQHGANPDAPDNSGFSPRMNGQYSKVMTKLFRDEDKRRETLPPHCVFCLYIPPEDFTPGKEPLAGGPFLLKDKEPPRQLMSCTCKSRKATYCSKKCQKADWRYHKLSCKAAKKA